MEYETTNTEPVWRSWTVKPLTQLLCEARRIIQTGMRLIDCKTTNTAVLEWGSLTKTTNTAVLEWGSLTVKPLIQRYCKARGIWNHSFRAGITLMDREITDTEPARGSWTVKPLTQWRCESHWLWDHRPIQCLWTAPMDSETTDTVTVSNPLTVKSPTDTVTV